MLYLNYTVGEGMYWAETPEYPVKDMGRFRGLVNTAADNAAVEMDIVEINRLYEEFNVNVRWNAHGAITEEELEYEKELIRLWEVIRQLPDEIWEGWQQWRLRCGLPRV